MSYQNISAVISAEDNTALRAAIQTLKTKLPFMVKLTIEERKSLRKMSARRTSYVQDVARIAINNPTAIPSGFSLAEYAKDAALFKELLDIFGLLLPIYESIRDTNMALSNELMKQTDECYGYLKVAARKSSNQSLSLSLKKVEEQLSGKPRHAPEA